MKKKCYDFKELIEKGCEEIEKCMPKVKDLLNEILEKNDEEFLANLEYYLYNYEQWFNDRKDRQRNLNKKEWSNIGKSSHYW